MSTPQVAARVNLSRPKEDVPPNTMGDPSEAGAVAESPASLQNQSSIEGISAIPADNDLKRKAVRGGAANVLAQGAMTALQIGTMVVLARLLTPADYGLQAMVLTLINLLSLIRNAGLSTATIQRANLTDELASTLFWFNVVLGIFLTVGAAVMGPFLAAFYKDPRLVWVTVASASVFLFNGLSAQHCALMDRAMRFTTSAKINILCATIGSGVAIGMAALGFGYWSLICQNISLPVLTMIAVWIVMPWWPGRPRWTPELRTVLRFGGTVTLNGVVVYFAYNAEKILLGRFWGAAPLGLYGRAYQLSNLPVQQLNDSCSSVAFPMLSRLQNDPERLRRSYLKSHYLVASLTVPAVIICALFAEQLVRIMLGARWAGAASVLRLLSPAILVFALMNPLSSLLRATGRVQRSLKIALFIGPVVILGVLAGIRHGPMGVAAGYSAAMVALFVPLVAWAKHGTGITTRDYWDCIKRPLIAGALAGAAAWLFKIAFHNVLTLIPLLIVGLTLFFAVYAGLLLVAMGQGSVYADLLIHLFPGIRQSPVET